MCPPLQSALTCPTLGLCRRLTVCVSMYLTMCISVWLKGSGGWECVAQMIQVVILITMSQLLIPITTSALLILITTSVFLF